jgi:hypothetical protein
LNPSLRSSKSKRLHPNPNARYTKDGGGVTPKLPSLCVECSCPSPRISPFPKSQ